MEGCVGLCGGFGFWSSRVFDSARARHWGAKSAIPPIKSDTYYARGGGCRGRIEGTRSDARVSALGQPAAGGPNPIHR